MAKIVIIGAGPAGNYTAYLLAKAGHEVDIYEEHEEIGLPFQCTGILTNYLEELMDVDEVVKGRLDTFEISTWEKKIDVKVAKPNLVLCRTSFDKKIAELAKKEGVNFHLQHRYINNDGQKIEIRDKVKEKIIEQEYDILIGADGPNSTVAKINKFRGRREYWVGAQARVKMQHKNKVEVYPHIGVFAWVVPETKDIARVGVYAKSNVNELFEKFMKERDCVEIIDRQGGLIPQYNPNIQTEMEKKGKKIYLVGDAATQVKATTGGGIIPGLVASQCLVEAINNGKNYTKLWKKKMGFDLWLHLRMHRILERFEKKDWNKLLELMNKPRTQRAIAEHDREYPSKFLLAMLAAEPRLLQFIKFLL